MKCLNIIQCRYNIHGYTCMGPTVVFSFFNYSSKFIFYHVPLLLQTTVNCFALPKHTKITLASGLLHLLMPLSRRCFSHIVPVMTPHCSDVSPEMSPSQRLSLTTYLLKINATTTIRLMPMPLLYFCLYHL